LQVLSRRRLHPDEQHPQGSGSLSLARQIEAAAALGVDRPPERHHLRALHRDLQKALADDEVERRRLSKALLPHVRAFYAGYFDPEQHQPFYRPSSRV
jgi:hypothetical protein